MTAVPNDADRALAGRLRRGLLLLEQRTVAPKGTAERFYADVRLAISALSTPPVQSEVGALREDAERFRALMRCGRIKMQGSAGVNPNSGERLYPDRPGSVHFGAEFWPLPATDPATGKVKVYEDCPRDMTVWGQHSLRALADDILAVEESALTTSTGDAT